jgi:hypothetical protein
MVGSSLHEGLLHQRLSDVTLPENVLDDYLIKGDLSVIQ